MHLYPKTENLYERDPETHRLTRRLKLPEFAAVRSWEFEEKIDGTNIRIGWEGYEEVKFGGRTDSAQLPAPLVAWLQERFTADRFWKTFENLCGSGTKVTLFGEGYGPKIQKGKSYRADQAFRLFDVRISGLWLNRESVADIGDRFDVLMPPILPWRGQPLTAIRDLVAGGFPSLVAEEDGGLGCEAEGIIARSSPLLLDRHGRRVMFKLKTKDLRKGETK